MTDETKTLLEAAAKIKQICNEHDCDKNYDCNKNCPFIQGRFCRLVDWAGECCYPGEWVIDWRDYED